MMKWIALTALSLLMSLSLAGCGDGGGSPGADSGAGGAGGDGNVAVVHLTGNDQMQYNKTEFTVQSGQTVQLTMEHVGELPVAAMGHNVVILKKGESYEEFGSETAAEGSIDNNYVPDSMLDRVIAHTELVGGGEKTQIEFTAPAPGEYPYLCTFPGHFVTMHGTMIVK